MNVNLSSSTSSANSLWSLLASRASAAGKSSSASSGATPYENSDTASASSRPDGPPPPPSQFNCAMSTAQFAGQAQMGPPPGKDPIASLDADDDGSVSADEFGLTDASDKVQDLFAAIDEDGSGALSTDEIDSFREQMMSADGDRPPMGPPPGGQMPRMGDDATSTSTSAVATQPDISSFLQQLAERYASLTSTTDSSSTLSAVA